MGGWGRWGGRGRKRWIILAEGNQWNCKSRSKWIFVSDTEREKDMWCKIKFTKTSLFRTVLGFLYVSVPTGVKIDRYDYCLNFMLYIAATDGGGKVLSGAFSALYPHFWVKSQARPKEHLEILCCVSLANLKVEQLEMWPMRIKAAVYIYMLHWMRKKYLPPGELIDGKSVCELREPENRKSDDIFPTFGGGVCQCVLCGKCILVSRRHLTFKAFNFLKLLPLGWRQSMPESICSVECNQIAQPELTGKPHS